MSAYRPVPRRQAGFRDCLARGVLNDELRRESASAGDRGGFELKIGPLGSRSTYREWDWNPAPAISVGGGIGLVNSSGIEMSLTSPEDYRGACGLV